MPFLGDPGFYTSRYSSQGDPAYYSAKYGVKCGKHLIAERVPLHLHDYYEMELCLSGCMVQTVAGVPVTTGDGEYAFMDLLTTQGIAVPESPVSTWTLSISPTEADPAILRLLGSVRFPVVGHLPPEALARADGIATALSEAIRTDPPFARERIAALTMLLLAELLEHADARRTPAEEPRTYHYIQEALLYINEHYAEELSLSALGEKIHISPCYLSDLFSRVVGCRFVEYLTRVRLSRAQMLLRAGGHRIAEIAAACGFGTPSNFTRAFRRAFGVSPSEYAENPNK